jgi:hypothetical protein
MFLASAGMSAFARSAPVADSRPSIASDANPRLESGTPSSADWISCALRAANLSAACDETSSETCDCSFDSSEFGADFGALARPSASIFALSASNSAREIDSGTGFGS